MTEKQRTGEVFLSLRHVELGVSQGEDSLASNFNMQGDSPVRYDVTELLEANLPSLGQHSLTLSRSRSLPILRKIGTQGTGIPEIGK